MSVMRFIEELTRSLCLRLAVTRIPVRVPMQTGRPIRLPRR
jgi:hypothetical protein